MTGGEAAHHKKCQNAVLRKADGTMAKNKEENAEIWEPHFTKVINNKQEVD